MFYKKTIQDIYEYIYEVNFNENISYKQTMLNAKLIGELRNRLQQLEEDVEILLAKKQTKKKGK